MSFRRRQGAVRVRALPAILGNAWLTPSERLVHHIGGMSYPLQGADLWLVDSIVVPASLHDVNGRVVHMNAAAGRAPRKSNAEAVGGPFTHPVPLEARQSGSAQFR